MVRSRTEGRLQDATTKYCAVIMAGSRGENDPVAKASGKSHKCLVEIAGIPMLIRVLDTVASSPHIGRAVLCVEPEVQNIPEVVERVRQGTLECLDPARSPAASALRACEELSEALPLLIVTADHPLLDIEMIDHFCSSARAGSDVCAGVAREGLVLKNYPGSRRTVLRFADDGYCGCNIFVLNSTSAAGAVAFWTRLEAERKRPWRLIRMLGVGSLLRYLCRRLTLADALAALSHKLGLEARAIEMPFAEAAIDVDKLADLELVEAIFNAQSAGRAWNEQILVDPGAKSTEES